MHKERIRKRMQRLEQAAIKGKLEHPILAKKADQRYNHLRRLLRKVE